MMGRKIVFQSSCQIDVNVVLYVRSLSVRIEIPLILLQGMKQQCNMRQHLDPESPSLLRPQSRR
jgi:hypothetical protein